jgi:hypothetical protein
MKGHFMAEERISDDDRLTEVGQIMAQGALRIISKKRKSSSKNVTCCRAKNVADCESGEKFVREKP